MHMACGPNFQPIEMVGGLGEVIGKNLNILVGALGQFTKRGWGSHLKYAFDNVSHNSVLKTQFGSTTCTSS